ncbi:glycosyltransferase sypN [Vibrio sp. JCM 19236]|nr:glycosyltransferase sypN [Vibrio sp. JCM 19236]
MVNIKTIPAPSGSAERVLAKWLMKQQLHSLIERHQLKNPILWSSLPTTADLCGELNESANVYYCGDDFSALQV